MTLQQPAQHTAPTALARQGERRAQGRQATVTPHPIDLSPLLGLRVPLAAMLFVHHAVHFHLRDTGRPWATAGLLHQGYFAVSLFFVLSGVALAVFWSPRLNGQTTLADAMRFVHWRWSALFPVAMAGLAVALAARIVANDVDAAQLLPELGVHVLLVQSLLPIGDTPHGLTLALNGPAWSVSTLMVFTALFPLLSARRDWFLENPVRIVLLAVVPWLAVTMLAISWQGDPWARWLFHSHPLMRGSDFLCGVAVGWWLASRAGTQTTQSRAGWLMEVGAIAAVSASLFVGAYGSLAAEVRYTGLYAPAATVLVLLLVRAQRGVLARVLSRPAVATLSRRSFAVLMLHVPVMQLLWALGAYEDSRWIGHAAAVTATLIAAEFVHRLWEVPARQRLRQMFETAPPNPHKLVASQGTERIV